MARREQTQPITIKGANWEGELRGERGQAKGFFLGLKNAWLEDMRDKAKKNQLTPEM